MKSIKGNFPQVQLVTAFAIDCLNIVAGLLYAQGYISDEISAKMLLPLTPNEEATLLVVAFREKIKLAPQLMFPELVKLFLENNSTKCIVNLLQSAKQGDEYANVMILDLLVRSFLCSKVRIWR